MSIRGENRQFEVQLSIRSNNLLNETTIVGSMRQLSIRMSGSSKIQEDGSNMANEIFRKLTDFCQISYEITASV